MQYYYDPYAAQRYEQQQRAWEEASRRRFQAEKEKREIRKISLGMGLAIIAYVVIQMLLGGILSMTGTADLLNTDPVFEYSVTIIFVSFLSVAVPFGIVALVFKSKYKYPLVPDKKVGAGNAALWVCLGMLGCIVTQISVSFLVSFFKTSFGIEMDLPEMAQSNSPTALVLECIGTAVVPAICEEFAMRCCSLQLLRKYGSGFAVFAVSVVFGLLHGNAVQFIFAGLIGLILGYVTIKAENIIPAILIHGFNNGMSVVYSAVKYFVNADLADDVELIIYVVWAALGVVAGIILWKKGMLKNKKEKGVSALTNGQKFSAFLFPWMIIPFLILIALTAQTVSMN